MSRAPAPAPSIDAELKALLRRVKLGRCLARVSNDHGFVALIMMLGFAGSWP
jgi:hypothetical protein